MKFHTAETRYTARIASTFLIGCLLATSCANAEQASRSLAKFFSPRFSIKVPETILTGVPIRSIVITAHQTDGEVDRGFNGELEVTGIRMRVNGEHAPVGKFTDGKLVLKTDLAAGRKIYVTGDEIIVDSNGERRQVFTIRTLWRWLSLVPPLVAILLAVWLRNVLVALFIAVWSGATLLSNANPLTGVLRTLDSFLIGELVQPGDTSKDHMLIMLFTVFLGAMIGVMAESGASAAMVNRLARFTHNRERGQMLTWLMGLIVFFDDYANTLLVGTTMRPVTDRLRISREKLAFLVDSTAAPVAGLALISTWVGFEIGQINEAFSGLNVEANAFSVFLMTWPYRFYSILLLAFVFSIAYSGRDFGPMLKAETRALSQEPPIQTNSVTSEVVEAEPDGMRSQRQLIRNAIIPLATLFALLLFGMWWTGIEGIAAENANLRSTGGEQLAVTLANVVRFSSGNRVLFLSSFLASAIAVVSVVATRSLNLQHAVEAWMSGAKSMFVPLIILVLAWGVATVCNDEHLNTAGFLVELTQGQLSVRWMPALAFLLAAVVSFSTGSSFSTMGLLIPLSISVTYHLLVPLDAAVPDHPLMLATIGAVLAGAIFGDHCSPISDTTVLSSAAAGCEHLEHVATQMPYAAFVAFVALLVGYVPVGFGYSVFWMLPIGLVVVVGGVRLLGRFPSDEAGE